MTITYTFGNHMGEAEAVLLFEGLQKPTDWPVWRISAAGNPWWPDDPLQGGDGWYKLSPNPIQMELV